MPEVLPSAEKAADLARSLYDSSLKETTKSERKRYQKLRALVNDPQTKAFLINLTDQAFRSKNPWRVARTVRTILRETPPNGFSFFERLAFKVFYRFSPLFAPLLVPFLKASIRKEAEQVILPGERDALKHHLEKRAKEGVSINLNRLGEAILGEDEAQERLETNLKDLRQKEINYISVKLTALYSQVNILDYEGSLHALEEPLTALYRTALDENKFVNLDMEEWRDVQLTKDLFIRLLSKEEFLPLSAGIVIQAYLPTAFNDLKELIAFAKDRVAKGGAPIKIRLVKGANLGMERIEASKKEWPQATYTTKRETDANFIRLLNYALKKEHLPYLKIGVGSHNLFDIAYALLLREQEGIEKMVTFEMLEGMNAPLRRAVHKKAGGILLYCPVAKKKDFHAAFSYLIRRLDENTGEDHFLRMLFSSDAQGWEKEKERFLQSVKEANTVSTVSHRRQNRFDPPEPLKGPFVNEADTDFSLKENRAWILNHLELFLKEGGRDIPSLIGGKVIDEGRDRLPRFDPSFPGRPLYTVLLATADDGEKAVQIVKKAQKEWKELPQEERFKRVGRVAQLLRSRRGELIAAMVADGGKTVSEADAEISEAIDFGEYYLRSAEEWKKRPGLEWEEKGVVLVASPWNFPLSIPAGGIFGALLSGNGVIFKPALETPLVGWRLAHCFWEAGIPKELLAFVVGLDETLGSSLIQNPDVAEVILTGSTETALHLLRLRPGLDLAAETGGKNSLIVTASADRDLAVRDIVASAFSHAGQKCSALSLLILEDEVYRDERFKKQLYDAVKSLPVGSAWHLSTKVPPLINPPRESLKRALTSLEEGEEWLLKPERDQENPQLFSPGIKWGVKEGSFTHQTELFGPVLAVMRAKNLDHACSIANGTSYGLTAGLHSLDKEEQEKWSRQIRAGNLYINRSITGAIVRRQPFGGCKGSQFGLGSKAGGPNYLTLFSKAKDVTTPQEEAPLSQPLIKLQQFVETLSIPEAEKAVFSTSLRNYQFEWDTHFSKRHDPSKVLGENNFFYYAPHHLLVIRVGKEDAVIDPLRIVALCLLASTPMEVSVTPEMSAFFLDRSLIPAREVFIETNEQFLQRMKKGSFQRVRSFSSPSQELINIFSKNGTFFVSDPVSSHGRIAFLAILREVALSAETHRYGHLYSSE